MNERIQRIRLIAMDVDGVLTKGEIMYTSSGDEVKTFNIKDGVALNAARRVGLHIAVITGRQSPALERRVNELKIAEVDMACDDKGAAIRDLLRRLELNPEEAAFIGDDLIDIPAFRECGFRIAVGDACEDVKALADYVTQAAGGQGAVREAVEMILKAQGKWALAVESTLQHYQRPEKA